MLILTIRTDKPEAEIGLCEEEKKLAYETWTAHRQLAATLHDKIRQLLHSQDKDWHDLQAVVVYEGPGSFTGLRIGISVANALAASLNIPITGGSGEGWLKSAQNLLVNGGHAAQIMPQYGSEAAVTKPKK